MPGRIASQRGEPRVTHHDEQQGDEKGREPEEVDLLIGELLTLEEASSYSGLSKHSLSTYIRSGRLKARKKGNLWLTTKAAVDAYLKSRDIESIPHKHRKTT
jgi:excisionase family DNA binding protein